MLMSHKLSIQRKEPKNLQYFKVSELNSHLSNTCNEFLHYKRHFIPFNSILKSLIDAQKLRKKLRS